MSVVEGWKGRSGVLVMARSRISSSELGALSQSTRSAVGYSRPSAGVTSKYSWLSRTPESFRGSRRWGLDTLGISVSIAPGAIVGS